MFGLWFFMVPVPCQHMEIYVKGDIDTAYFQARAVEVLEALSGEESIDFTLVILENMDFCEAAADELVKGERAAFIAQCEDMAVSSSFREEGQEYIIVKADKPFLTQEPAAARGLIAHEVIHMVLRQRGMDELVHTTAKRHVGRLAEQLVTFGIREKRAVQFAAEVMRTSTLTVKDLLANAELIEQGFFADLVSYYYHVLQLDEYVPAPAFYSDEPHVEEVQKAVTFELYIMPSWLPFVVCDKDACATLVDAVQQQYERHLATTVSYMHAVEDVYREHYSQPEVLVEAVYPVLVQAILQVVEEQLGTGSEDSQHD